MEKKRFISRRIFLAAGILCVVVILILGGVVTNYNSLLNSKNAQISNTQNENALLNSCISADNATVNSLNEQISRLQNQNTAQNSTIINLQGQVTADNSTMVNLQGQVKAQNSTIINLQGQVTADNSTMVNLQGQESSNTATIDSLNNQMTALQGQTESDNSTIANLQNDLATYNSSIAALQSQISAQNSTINSLTAELNSLQDHISSGNSTLTSNSTATGNSTEFSVVQITDTQYLTESYPGLFDGLTSWIVNNSLALNLKMVIHTGDIVQDSYSTTDWSNANGAMMQLYSNNIPYCWDAGNHDQFRDSGTSGTNGDGDPNLSWMGQNYPAFNATIMRNQTYWAGDINYGKDTAVQFAVGQYRFMIINLEYDANQTVLNWMESLLQSNPNVNIIIATHNLLNGDGGYGYPPNAASMVWATNFENLLNIYPNVFMTLNGHSVGSAMAANIRVGQREEIFFNMQDADGQQGAATARIYTFNLTPNNETVTVNTCETFENDQYLTDEPNQFSFSTNLTAYSPSQTSFVGNTRFFTADDNSVSFINSTTLSGFSQNGDTLAFMNLTLNGVTSNLKVTTVGTDIAISNYDTIGWINYTVSAEGVQTIFTDKMPTSVLIDGVQTNSGWSYSNGVIAVTSASSSVSIGFS